MDELEACQEVAYQLNRLNWTSVRIRELDGGVISAGAWPKGKKWVDQFDDPSIVYGFGQDLTLAYLDLAEKLSLIEEQNP